MTTETMDGGKLIIDGTAWTKRDEIAVMFLHGQAAGGIAVDATHAKEHARRAYLFADAFLEQRAGR